MLKNWSEMITLINLIDARGDRKVIYILRHEDSIMQILLFKNLTLITPDFF
jgi:hypothetical protein